MEKIILLLACFGLIDTVSAQRVDWKKLDTLKPDKVLLDKSHPPTKVLLLGTFHFAYPNLDDHKTDSANFVDVLSPVRQKELQELANVIEKFKPTRIYVESFNQRFHDSLFTAYKNNQYKLGRNEIYQVGYRVAKDMNLDKVYAVDASNFLSDYYRRFSFIDSLRKVNNPVDSVRDQYWMKKYSTLYTMSDSIENKLTMLENFLLMAEPSSLSRMHGAYLTTGFNTQAGNGADLLAMWWYSRNLRIFNNILKTQPTGQDRIVVLFGNGHAPILKHCFQSSPEFEVVELKSLL